MDSPLLQVDDLTVRYRSAGTTTTAVRDVSLSIPSGSSVGVVGESGSGKSTLALALLGLLPPNSEVRGHVAVDGVEIVGADRHTLEKIRGSKIGLVYQDALVSLNPVRSVGSQIAEVFRYRPDHVDRRTAKNLALEALARVGISEPKSRYGQYPHQFSGGMRQRVAIAMALAAEPKLLVADEITTGLDVTVQAQILRLLAGLQQEMGMSILIVSHDFEVVRSIADTVAVFYHGRIVEYGATAEVFAKPRHPYTSALLASAPTIDEPVISYIPGAPPPAGLILPGCAFEPRCLLGAGRSECQHIDPPLAEIPGEDQTRRSACHFSAEVGGILR